MDPVFKGASRPPLVLGIPLLPFMLVAGGGGVLVIWMALLLGKMVAIAGAVASVVCLAAMRWVSANDPHRLNQVLMMLGRWLTGRRAALYWGHRTVSPVDLSRRAPPQPYD